jgi:hypothetical protein
MNAAFPSVVAAVSAATNAKPSAAKTWSARILMLVQRAAE